jgi:HK97 family phage prohead protease
MEQPMKLTLQASEITADEGRRLISGKILPFGDEIGHTNVGKVRFRAGSVKFEDPKKVKFLLEHDGRKPLGRAQSIVEEDDALYATFRVANTSRGSDALVEASEDLRSGLSVGVEVIDSKQVGNVLEVIEARLEEVSLVSNPAFKSAEVLEVAASEAEAEEAVQPTENESEATVEITPESVAPEAVETPVEASRPTVTAMAYTKPRIEITPAKYLENKIQAALGSEDARQYILAADSTDNAGMVPTRQLAEVVNALSTTIRPSIDAISRGTLPDAGLTFEIPRVTQAPTVEIEPEGAAFSNTDLESNFITVSIQKFAGQQKFSVELLTRTSPVFFDELLRAMAAAKAKAENAYVNGVLISGATLDSTTVAAYPSASELLGIVARGSAAVYGATAGLGNPFARNMVVSTGQWSNIMGLNDGGRPIYNASQPQNAGGVVTPTSLLGNVAGLNLYVDPTNAGDGDGTILVINPDAYTWYESPTYQLRAEATADGSVTVGLYSFGAVATKVAAGAFKNNKQ